MTVMFGEQEFYEIFEKIYDGATNNGVMLDAPSCAILIEYLEETAQAAETLIYMTNCGWRWVESPIPGYYRGDEFVCEDDAAERLAEYLRNKK